MSSHTAFESLRNSYSIDIANKMGISEGELANFRLAHDARKLSVENIKVFINDLERLEKVKSITRNKYAITIQDGELTNQYLNGYKEMDISASAGLILNPRSLDLRIFFKHWNHIFYFHEIKAKKELHSIQTFDKYGTAINKIYILPDSNKDILKYILNKYQDHEYAPVKFISDEDKKEIIRNACLSVDENIDTDWRNMREVHDFYLLMRKYNMSRQDLFRSVKDDLAYRVSNQAIHDIFTLAKIQDEELTIFIANIGCVQIYTGKILKTAHLNGWFNIFNKDNRMHIKDEDIHETWVVKKPGEYGYVTSLEVFSKDGEQIIQIYGQRNEQEEERQSWRNIIESIKSNGV